MSDLLYKGQRAIGLRRRPEDIAGWPEVQRELAPIALDRDERRLYDATWREFRRELGLAGGQHPAPGRLGRGPALPPEGEPAAHRRHRRFRRALLDDGAAGGDLGRFPRRPAPCWPRRCGAGAGASAPSTATQTADANEATRVAFQTGALDVVVFTVTEVDLAAPQRDAGRRPGPRRSSSTTCATAPSSSPRSRAAATATASAA